MEIWISAWQEVQKDVYKRQQEDPHKFDGKLKIKSISRSEQGDNLAWT